MTNITSAIVDHRRWRFEPKVALGDGRPRPPVKEPPSPPERPPVEEPERPPKGPFPPRRPPMEDPPDAPQEQPVEEPPPEDPNRQPPHPPQRRVGEQGEARAVTAS